MRRFFTYTILTGLLFLSVGAKAQEEILYLNGIEPMFSISSPSSWKTSKKSGTLTFQSKDNGQLCWIAQTTLEKPEIGVTKVTEFAKTYLNSFESQKNESFTKNKITFYKVEGHGKLNGKDGSVNVLFFRPSKKANEKVVFIVYFTPIQVEANQDTNFKEILSSIYPR